MTIEFKKASKYDVLIRHAANGGCVVKIGCCEVAYTTTDEMLKDLAEYYKDPAGMEKKYNNSECTPEAMMVDTGRPIGLTTLRRRYEIETGEPRNLNDDPIEQCEKEPDPTATIDHPGNN